MNKCSTTHRCYHSKIGQYFIGNERVCYDCFVQEIKIRAEKDILNAQYGGRLNEKGGINEN